MMIENNDDDDDDDGDVMAESGSQAASPDAASPTADPGDQASPFRIGRGV